MRRVRAGFVDTGVAQQRFFYEVGEGKRQASVCPSCNGSEGEAPTDRTAGRNRSTLTNRDPAARAGGKYITCSLAPARLGWCCCNSLTALKPSHNSHRTRPSGIFCSPCAIFSCSPQPTAAKSLVENQPVA